MQLTTFISPDKPLKAETAAAAFHVVLIRGPILSSKRSVNNEATPALAYALIGSVLRNRGYRVTVIDSISMGLNRFWEWQERPGFVCQGASIEETVAAIPEDVDLIGFSCMFSGEWPVTRKIINKVRERFPDVPTIAGGEHATALPDYTLRDCPGLDYVGHGEGEFLLYDFCEVLRKGEDPHQFKGISYRTAEGASFQNERFSRIDDIDSVPWPDWELVSLEPFWKSQKSYGIATAKDMPLMVSRGCPYRCTFCSSPLMWTTKYLLRNVDDVLDEVQGYIDRYGITSLQFYDLTAITKKSWTLEFCNRMIERGINIQWTLPSGTRSEALDEDVIPLLAKTHCTYLVYAPESGCEETLKAIKKRVNLEKLEISLRLAKKHGIVLRTNLIIGFPHETRKQMFTTILYGLKLAFMGVDEVSINIFSPYPGSELFMGLFDQGKIHLDDNYFYSLTSLNSDYTTSASITFCSAVGKRELSFYRIFFMLSNYFISYVFFPKRIYRTLKNIILHRSAQTVFEHRLQDLWKRKTSADSTSRPTPEP